MDAAPAALLYLDHAVVPSRSMPKTGFIVLIGLIVLVNVAVGTMFVLMGAPPIPIFLGLDILGVTIAFRKSYEQAHRFEQVQVSAEEVRVIRRTPKSETVVWSTPTAFTRVLLEEPREHEARVRLQLSARRLTIGQALGMEGRRDLAALVEDAISRARRERHN